MSDGLAQLHLFAPPAPKGPRLNPSVGQADKTRLTAQARRIYQRLQEGPVSTGELAGMAAQYNARIKELRDYLRDFGLTVDRVSHNPRGDNRYILRSFHGSNYEKTLMAKGIRR